MSGPVNGYTEFRRVALGNRPLVRSGADTNRGEASSVGIDAAAYYLPENRMTVEEWLARNAMPANRAATLRAHGHAHVHIGGSSTMLELAFRAVDRLVQARPLLDRNSVEAILHCYTTQHSLPPAPFSVASAIKGEFGFSAAKCYSIAQLNCVSAVAALKAARALLRGAPPDRTVLIVTADRESNEPYRVNADFTIINSDGASAALIRKGTRRNRLGAVLIRNYSHMHGGVADEGYVKNQFRLRMIEWNAAYEVIAAAIAHSRAAPGEFTRLLPHNVSMQGWHGVARRLGREPDFVFADNIALKAHAYCADAFINLLDGGYLDVGAGHAIVVGCQSNNGAFGAFTLHESREPQAAEPVRTWNHSESPT